MAETTGINWTDSTFNPWIGCTKIAPACDFCYAEALMDHRHHRVEWGGARSRTSASNWNNPRRWQKNASAFQAEHGRRQRVFCASLADVFDNQVPEEWRADLWALIRDCPDLDWQLLTKRPQNIAKMLPIYPIWGEIKGRIWLGTTVEDQKHADQNIPHLLQHDSAVRFLSCEPLLGPIDLSPWIGMRWPSCGCSYGPREPEVDIDRNGVERCPRCNYALGGDPRHGINWVITGGESGSNARPTHPQWFRDIRDQCAAAGVAYLHKQNGEWIWHGDIGEDEPAFMRAQADYIHRSDLKKVHFFEDGQNVARVGTKNSGRTLDGVTHDAFPAAQ